MRKDPLSPLPHLMFSRTEERFSHHSLIHTVNRLIRSGAPAYPTKKEPPATEALFLGERAFALTY